MATIKPFVAPSSGDQPWVDQIRQTLKTQLSVAVDTPPISIFSIPKNLKDEKLDAYEPQLIGLGPKHHFQTELYEKMQQNKLTAVKRVLKPLQIPDCEDQIVDKIKEVLPVVSACYDKYPEVEDEALAWLFAIDGLFLLDQLTAYIDYGLAINEKDLMMLENQIPLIVLKEIHKAICGEENAQGEDFWESKFRFFCKSNSPFLLSKENIDFKRVNHLLDYMYHSIVNNETSSSINVRFRQPGSVPDVKPATEELLEAFIQAAGVIPAAKPFIGILESMEKILYESDDDKTSIQEIKVPSVSELRDIAGVNFRLSPGDEGIRNVGYIDGSCYLPVITLNFDSEVILRNLVAYEQLMTKNSYMGGFGLELTEYVDFMCGIIDNAKDVKLLREEKIIQGDLRDEDVVALFNGIGRSLGNMSGESKFRMTVAELNKVYDSIPSVRFKNQVEKQVRASAKALTFLVSISGTLVLVREAISKIDLDPSQVLVQFLSEHVNVGVFSSLIQ